MEATQLSSDSTKVAINNLRGVTVAEATATGLLDVRRVDEFGVVTGGLPSSRRYGFHGSKQREALTVGGTIAMGVRLYVPRVGRFLQVDPVLGGTASPYAYPSDPVNQQDLDGMRRRSKKRRKTRRKKRPVRTYHMNYTTNVLLPVPFLPDPNPQVVTIDVSWKGDGDHVSSPVPAVSCAGPTSYGVIVSSFSCDVQVAGSSYYGFASDGAHDRGFWFRVQISVTACMLNGIGACTTEVFNEWFYLHADGTWNNALALSPYL